MRWVDLGGMNALEQQFSPIGDCGIRISFGSEPSPERSRKMMNFKEQIESSALGGITDIIPGYATLAIFYDPFEWTYPALCAELKTILSELDEAAVKAPIVYHIPVCYEEPFNLDLDDVAQMNQLAANEVVSLHANRLYYIYMLGFLPGFPYLGGMDKRIAAPRLASPRLNVSAGSVGIAGEQTGVYPLQSPGGWRIIGKTPIRLYDPDRKPAILLSAGNYVRFYPISYDDYTNIEKEVIRGVFCVKTTEYIGDSHVSN